MGIHSLQTMRLSFAQICEGQIPWIPLGKFMHDWYELHRNCREQLLFEPLQDEHPQEFQNWAAFCAASVRWFCSTYEIACPLWVDNPKYILPEPWCMDKLSLSWESERETTAPEFVHHNIYCGNRVYTNKYERDERGWPLRTHPVDLQNRRAAVRLAAIRLDKDQAWAEEAYQEYLLLRQARVGARRDQRRVIS